MSNKSDIERLIEEIEEFIDGCRLQPFSSTKIIVDKAELEALLVELRNSTPDEIKKYRKVLNTQQTIINDAKQQAEAILTAANVQANEMVNQSEIIRQAHSKANEIIAQANREASTIVNDAADQANALAQGAYDYTDKLLGDVQQTIAELGESIREHGSALMSSLEQSVNTLSQNRSELMPPSSYQEMAGEEEEESGEE